MSDLNLTPPASETVPPTPAVTTPNPATPPQEAAKTFPEDYVKNLRGEAADARTKLREAETKLKALELEKLSEAERIQRERDDYKAKAEELEKQITEQSLRLLRAEAVNKHKLPATWIDRLKGTTAEELDRDAAEVAKDLAPPKAPNAEAGDKGGGMTKAQAMERAKQEAMKSGKYAA